MIPLVFFFFLEFFFKATFTNFIKVFILAVPLILSFSLGVLGSAVFSIILLFLSNYYKVFTQTRFFKWVIRVFVLATLLSLLLLLFYPHNPLFLRIQDITMGADSSAKGRTFEAFELAFTIAKLKSLWWGVGLGQVKIVGYETIISYYNYPRELFPTVRIPNAFAETIAVFGVVGAFIRLSTQVYLFFKSQVLSNYYRTLLFFFVFIYQFTGSYLTNIAEYVIWIMAFTNTFPQFNKQHLSSLTNLKSQAKASYKAE
jgi:F0F1-type ATP synthase membrane subunit c/vacuolar-type H+-ATPase subunit K